MNTRTFQIVLVSQERMRDMVAKVNATTFDSKSEEKTDKYQMKTFWSEKRPAYKYYEYKSWTRYLHDFLNQINYQYIPD